MNGARTYAVILVGLGFAGGCSRGGAVVDAGRDIADSAVTDTSIDAEGDTSVDAEASIDADARFDVDTDAGADADADADMNATGNDADASSSDSADVPADITKVTPTIGCGQPAGQTPGIAVRGTIPTMGTKVANCSDAKCGAWTYEREYFVTLPLGYLNTKAYPLVFQGPGCTGSGTAVYPLNNSADQTIIRVGLTPPPNDIGHATNPGQNCFDDEEGDDSVDWVFFENLYDRLATQICFDKNRVFASGAGSGSRLANELGCKYTGDVQRPIRAVMTNGGGLPSDPRFVPTCTNQPMAGMWVGENDTTSDALPVFSGAKVAIARAMKVNQCTIGTSFDNAMFVDFPIAGVSPPSTCRRILGCPDLFPLVACALPNTTPNASSDAIANSGFVAFLNFFPPPP
ncbi:MAG TPA: hypothetical protein VGL59_22230 [Polyangia bacterium]|jgi:hypothetical protein